MEKKCKDCGEIKKQSDFYGVQGECKQCTKIRVKNRYQSQGEANVKYENSRNKKPKRLFLRKYYAMRQRINGTAAHTASVLGKELLSKDEFIGWCFSRESMQKFNILYEIWEKEGYPKKLCPSIDRINNKKSYILGNLQWLSHSENSSKQQK